MQKNKKIQKVVAATLHILKSCWKMFYIFPSFQRVSIFPLKFSQDFFEFLNE